MAKTRKNFSRKTKARKTGKKKMSPWNAFVKKIYARENKNGNKSFKECLKIAAKEKKQGKMN